MKTVYIVGTGANSPTAEAMSVIERCGVIVGAERLVRDFAYLEKPSFVGYTPEKVCEAIKKSDCENIAVLVSGDTGFYSAARTIAGALTDCEVRFVAGTASICGLAARLRTSWQDAALVSFHGVTPPLVSAVRRSEKTFCLTGGNTAEIGKILTDAGFGGLTVHVGENLGYPDEKVYACEAKKLAETAPLCVIMIENPSFSAKTRFGIPDGEFIRVEGVPMTKCETRAVIMSKLGLPVTGTAWDVGAGTGSVTVEMALSMYNGQVYAVEAKKAALDTVIKNCRAFHVGNVTPVHGKAPEVLESLPAPDAVFIGGSGGRMREIVDAAVNKNPSVRIVAAAVAVESVGAALAAFEEAGVQNVELCQISAARAEKRAGLHMMTGQNPITIIIGGGV